MFFSVMLLYLGRLIGLLYIRIENTFDELDYLTKDRLYRIVAICEGSVLLKPIQFLDINYVVNRKIPPLYLIQYTKRTVARAYSRCYTDFSFLLTI
jgi:hypothetical protein